MVISAHVYHFQGAACLEWNHEVEQAFWFPVADLLDARRHVAYPREFEGMQMPGILVGLPGRHIVWGLTYRFLDIFLSAIGHPLPERWADQKASSNTRNTQ